MTRGMAVGMGGAHDGILRYGPGATTDVTTTGDVIAGATIDFETRVGGHATIDGGTTTGAIGGPTTGGAIDETVAINLCGVPKFGIAGDKVVPIAVYDLSSTNGGCQATFAFLTPSKLIRIMNSFADVAELADAQVSEACDGDIVEVQVLSSAPLVFDALLAFEAHLTSPKRH